MRFRPCPGVPVTSIVAALGVSLRTARRWRRTGRMPEAFAKLWQLHDDPDLGHLDALWRGWKLRDGLLWLPEGVSLRPGDVRALPLLLQLQRLVRRREHQPVQFLLDV